MILVRLLILHYVLVRLVELYNRGMGIAFSEIVRTDAKTGEVLDDSLKKYDLINAYDMPDIKVIFIEQPDETRPFGAKSIGKSHLYQLRQL